MIRKLFDITGHLKPVIPWVGGKTNILSDIIPMLPKYFNHYYEPFVGGGGIVL